MNKVDLYGKHKSQKCKGSKKVYQWASLVTNGHHIITFMVFSLLSSQTALPSNTSRDIFGILFYGVNALSCQTRQDKATTT
ncbi:hypothetical protein AQUCO_00201362v1 [Aquilegia coerulea]|uniref:Uncharacterized protein n=1 Tax=Aquilegia coerulea TaxID=218851 RepID=A0A2G5F7N2_AQUCA|nr:hypothetical protein AQUCO_00201362v1 [Aquilegia coerulea]